MKGGSCSPLVGFSASHGGALVKSEDVSVLVEDRYAALKSTLKFSTMILEQAMSDGNLWELERLMTMFELLKGRQMLSQ